MTDPPASPFDALAANEVGVLEREGTRDPFGYVDGAEGHLLELMAVARDRSASSGELPALISDWPSEYHLSPRRWALLDGLELPRGRVLEIGAGCGALTAWLAENAESVDAVEGSPTRAAVIRSRCRDADNVRVIAGDISQFEAAPAYDVVTLIGVLEYARCFGRTAGLERFEATRRMLAAARDWLAPGGVLVLAIENQFGLKYLAGHVEDHTGGAYDGLEGYLAPGTAVTFSRAQLEALLSDVGMSVDELLLPFPDYKLPDTLINANRPLDGVAAWAGTPWTECGTGRRPASFNEGLALRQAERGGLLADLANSFLIVARRMDEARGPSIPWSVRHYALDRQPALRKRKTLIATDGGARVVVESLAGGAPVSHAFASLPFAQHLDDEEFVAGDLLPLRLLALGDAERPAGLVALMAEHAEWLVSSFAADAVRASPPDPQTLLDGAAFDAQPLNVLVDAAGGRSAIDLEWRREDRLPLLDALWRSAYVLMIRWKDYLLPDDGRTAAEIARDVTTAALKIEPETFDWRAAEARELVFQAAVRGGDGAGSLSARLAARQFDHLRAMQALREEHGRVERDLHESRRRLAEIEERERAATAARDVEREAHAAESRLLREEAIAARADANAERARGEAIRASRIMRIARWWWRVRAALRRTDG